MLVLIATNELQGREPDDYSFTVEGELVAPVANECASSDECGCARGFPGLASGFATTTAMVVDRPGVSIGDLRDGVYDWLDRGGWIETLEHSPDVSCLSEDARRDRVAWMVEGFIDQHVRAIREVCEAFPLGSIIIRHGKVLRTRYSPSAA